MMMLFYSNHCTSSKLLIDNIKRYDAMKHFKLINVEQYMANGYKMPPQIHSVPAIMFTETKTVIFGKQVFDYLLLPKKGFLLNLVSPAVTGSSGEASASAPPSAIGSAATTTEPMSFNLHAGVGSDTFSFIDETTGTGTDERPTSWCGIDEQLVIQTPEDSSSGEGGKKKMPDIATLRSQRELDIQQCTASAVPVAL